MKSNNIIVPIILVITSFFYLTVIIFQNRSLYFKKYNHEATKKQYDQSQWQQSQNFSEDVVLEKWSTKQGYTGWNNFVDENMGKKDIEKIKHSIIEEIKSKGMSDAQLYTYAGYEYMRGKDPTLLNPEHPPLGKYLIGISITIFNNEHIVILITGVLILILLFLLVYLASHSLLASAVAILLTTTHSLFIDQLIHGPQLDIFQLLFLMCFVLFLHLYVIKNRLIYLLFTGISFGCLISIKTFISYFLLFNFWLVIYFLWQRKNLLKNFVSLLLINVIGLLVFLSTYLSFFIHGGNIKKFLGVQKYIVVFYKQSGINPLPFIGNYLRLIFTGSWKFWSQGNPISTYDQWSFTWVAIFLVGIYVLFRSLRNQSVENCFSQLLITYLIVFNMFLFIFPIFPRYLLLLFVPFHALIAFYFFSKKRK